jgi:HD-GYP domain-containing protein (c-di-GMP phosphodiesterase class II)
MLKLPTIQAFAGMVLADPVYHPLHPSVTLLRAGVTLDDHSIKRLHEIGVRELWIQYPPLEAIRRFVNPAAVTACRDMATRIAQTMDELVENKHAKLEYDSFRRAVVAVVDSLSENASAALFIFESATSARPALRHASNVCFLSILMGLKLEFYLVHERNRVHASLAKDVSSLGVGAMMHDIGMLHLPDHVLDRWNATRDENDPAWREHVQLGFDHVKKDFDPTAAGIVLHHHQHFDGSGFPQRTEFSGKGRALQGSDIHIFARIVAAADIFDRLRHPAHAPRAELLDIPSVPAVRALSTMLKPPYRSWIDPIVLCGLLASAPPYPPGSLVKLSDGREAVVVDWVPEDPCRPTVEIITDLREMLRPNQRPKPRERISLRRMPELYIAEIDGYDVSKDNFTPSAVGEFDLNRVARSLVNAAA